MNIQQAIEDTMILADQSQVSSYPIFDLSYEHIRSMHERIHLNPEWSDTKLCRWLGWMQAAIVSWGVYTLEDMKQINLRNAD